MHPYGKVLVTVKLMEAVIIARYLIVFQENTGLRFCLVLVLGNNLKTFTSIYKEQSFYSW